MTTRRLFDSQTKQEIDVSEQDVPKYINTGRYRFLMGDKVPMLVRDVGYQMVGSDEAYSRMKDKTGRYVDQLTFREKDVEEDLNTVGGHFGSAVIGASDFLLSPLPTAAVGFLGDKVADVTNEYLDTDFGHISDYISGAADVNPWTYNLTGIAATGIGGIAGGAFLGTAAAPGPGTIAGGVAGGVGGVAKGIAQSQAKAAGANLLRSGWTTKIQNLWKAVFGTTAGKKVGELAAKTPAVWAMKVGNMKRAELTKILSDSAVNGALSKVNPGLARLFAPVAAGGKEAAKYSFGATATAGMMEAAVEGALFWGPTAGVSEILLQHEDMTLEKAAHFMAHSIGLNAAAGMGMSGAMDFGLKGAAIVGREGLNAAGTAYHWMGEGPIGQTVNKAWRATARTVGGLDAQGQKNLDYMYEAGETGYARRKAILHMRDNFHGETVPEIEKLTNMIWVLNDFVEQTSNGAFNHEFVTKTLKREVDAGNIEGDYLAALTDAYGTLQQADELLTTLKPRVSAGMDPVAPSPEDQRIIEAFSHALTNVRANLGRSVLKQTKTVIQSSDDDLIKIQEAREFFAEHEDDFMDTLINQFGILFEDPDAAIPRTVTGKPKKYFEDDAIGEEGFGASELSAELDPDSTYDSMLSEFDSIDDQIALESHPDYDPVTGKILIEKEFRERQFDALRGILPEREAIQFNHDGHIYRWIEKEKRYVDARGNYLQKSPKYYKYVSKKREVVSHRAPYSENWIDIQGEMTQNPVQYEHYIDKSTGKVKRVGAKTQEAFEEYVDQDGRTRVRAKETPVGKRPPLLSDSQRHHYSQELNRVEGDVHALEKAQSAIENQIQAAQSGAPVPMERIAGKELLAPLSESGVPEQLNALDEQISGIEFLIREEINNIPGPPQRKLSGAAWKSVPGSSGFDQHKAVVERQRVRAEVQAKIDKLKEPLRDLRKQREDLVQRTGPELETIFEIQDPRLSHELSSAIEDGSKRVHDSLSSSFDDTAAAIDAIPKGVKKLLEEEGYDIWNALLPMHRLARSYDDGRALIDGSGGERFSLDYANQVKDQLLAQAERIEQAARESVDFLEGTFSFKGKKRIRKSILKYAEKTSIELRELAEQAKEGVSVLEAWSTSPAASQRRLDALGSQLGKVKADLHKRQLLASDFESKLEQLPPIAGKGSMTEADFKYQKELNSARLTVKEARRAMNTHTEHARLLRDDYDKILNEVKQLKELRAAAPNKLAQKEAHYLLKAMEKRAKEQLAMIKRIETKSWKTEKKRLHRELKNLTLKQDDILARGGPRAVHSVADAEYPTPLSTPGRVEDIVGGIERPSAARLSELAKSNITDAERASLHKLSGNKVGDRAYVHGTKLSPDPEDTRWQYDDDLIRFLEEQRLAFLDFGRKRSKKGELLGTYDIDGTRRQQVVGPGYVSGRTLDELGPDPLRGELGAPVPPRSTAEEPTRGVDVSAPDRVQYALKDKDGRIKNTAKGLGYDTKKFGMEGRPIEVFTKAESPGLPPMEEFRRVIAIAKETGDSTELEKLMGAMGLLRGFEPYYGKKTVKLAGGEEASKIQTLNELFGYKPKASAELLGQAPSRAIDIREAVERIKNPTKETFEVESEFIAEINRKMQESRANLGPERHGDDLAAMIAEEERVFQTAKEMAEDNGDLSLLYELASKYKVSIQSPDQLADLFIAMQKLKNEFHFVSSHQHLGEAGQKKFDELNQLIDEFITGAAPRPVAGAFPAQRNHFGNTADNTGMAREVHEFKQRMGNLSQLQSKLTSQIGDIDPMHPSPAAEQTSQEKIRKLMLSMDKDNVHSKMEPMVAYTSQVSALLRDIDQKHDVGKMMIRRTAKHNEAMQKAGITPAKDALGTFKRIMGYSEHTRNKILGIQRYMSSRKFQAALEFGIKANGTAWSSALASAGIAGISFGAFLVHPLATPLAAMGLAAMNPRAAAMRLSQMEKLARITQQKIKQATDDFVYESIMKKGRKYSSAVAGFERLSIPRAFIGPSAPLRNAGMLETYQEDAAKREIASEEFLQTKKFITRLVTNENEMAEFIDRAIPAGLDEYAPTIRKHMQDSMRIKVMAAYESMPRTFASEFMSTDTLPSTMEMSQWARDLQAIQDPLTTLIDGLTTGSLTKREVKMIQKTDPLIYQEVVSNIVEALSDPALQSRISYRTKIHLETLMGIQFTRPSTVQYLQKAFQAKRNKEQAQKSPQFNRVMQSTQQSAGSTVDTVERSQ